MSVNGRKELWVGFVTAILGCLWALITQELFVTSQSTALQMLLMVWVILHLPLHVILSVIDPPRYLDPAIFYVGASVQWFLIGWAGYRIRRKFLAISSIR
jgi:multisubunit Na+/H+ antiporter MnhE subunit